MKKISLMHISITMFVLMISSAYTQTATITFHPVDQSGHLICKDTTTVRVTISQPVDFVAVFFRKRGQTGDFSLIDKTTAYQLIGGNYRYSINWNISGLSNKEYYDIKVEIKIGGSSSLLYDWVQIDRNPRVHIIDISYSTSTTGVFSPPVYYNNYYYLRDGYLRVILYFTDCTGSPVTMKTDTHPDTKLVIGTRSLPFNTTYYWVQSIYWVGVAEIPADVPNGYAKLEITNAISSTGYSMEPFSTEMFILDTRPPTIVDIKVDENGDGDFTNNNGYLNLGETGRVYVWISEYLTPRPTAYFKIGDKPERGLGNIIWVSSISIGGTHYGNFGYFTLPSITNLMGEGEATIVIHPYPTAKDFAGNYLEMKTITYKVDAVPPTPPVIITPTNSTIVPRELPIEVAIQDPQETDIKYVEFRNNLGFNVFDFNKPYRVFLPAASPITVRVYDNADNISQTQVYFNTTPAVDKKPPKAKITSVSDSLTSTLEAQVNDTDVNVIEVKFQYSLNKTTWTDIYIDYNSPWQARWDVRNLKDGIYYLRAVAKDRNNNIDPNPTIITVEKYPQGLRIDQDSASYEPPAKASIKIELDGNKQPKQAIVKVTCKQQPYINIGIYDTLYQLVYAIPSTELSVTAKGGNYTTTVPLDVIKSTGGFIFAGVFVADESDVSYAGAFASVYPVDPKKDMNLWMIQIPADTLTSKNTLILEDTHDVPPADDGLVILKAYNLSWAEPVNRFNKDVTLTFTYSTVNNFYPYSTAQYQKFTICSWDGKKWITDKDMTLLSPTASQAQIKTKHSSYFALVADYSKPKIEKFDIVGRTFFGKVTDTGSGISTVTVTIDGKTYTATASGGDGSYEPQTGDFYIRVGETLTVGNRYLYVFTVTDRVGNQTRLTGSFVYTGELATKDIHNYPNPFDPDKEITKIQFAVGEYISGEIRLTIFDFNGEVVYTKSDWWWLPGMYEIPWDGRNNQGNKVPNGVYFGRIEIGNNYKSDYFKIAVLRKK